MQLKISTNYAIRIILTLAKQKKMTCRDLAEQLDMGESYISAILGKLNKAGIITVVQGVNGGYVLQSDLTSLTLFDVLMITENTVKINRCLEDDEFCSRGAIQTCSVRKKYEDIQAIIEDELSRLTFSDLLKSEGS